MNYVVPLTSDLLMLFRAFIDVFVDAFPISVSSRRTLARLVPQAFLDSVGRFYYTRLSSI